MDVKKKQQFRRLTMIVVVAALAVVAYIKRDRIIPALGEAAEKGYNAADDLSEGEYGR